MVAKKGKRTKEEETVMSGVWRQEYLLISRGKIIQFAELEQGEHRKPSCVGG